MSDAVRISRREAAPPLAEARTAWVAALEAVAAFEEQPPVRDRAAQAARQEQQAFLHRQLEGAQGRWRVLEMQAKNALTTVLVSQAQLGRGSSAEQARCTAALQAAQAELEALVGGEGDTCVTRAKELLVPPIIDGKKILPPMI